MVELDVSSWEHYKEQMNMLQEQLDTVPQVEEPLINRRLSRLPAWIPKAPETAPIEADPFQLRSEPLDNSILVLLFPMLRTHNSKGNVDFYRLVRRRPR